MIRVALVEVESSGFLLMVDMHHIISDGVSHAILEQDFKQIYQGNVLEPLRLQYKDYSEWMNSQQHVVRLRDQEKYWLARFEGELPVLNLPTDYPRPEVQSFEGATVNFTLGEEVVSKLKAMATEQGLTLYMLLLSAYTLLLSKLSGQTDIVVGTPIAGRRHVDLERIVGMFVNVLPMRTTVSSVSPVKNLLEDIRQTALEAYDHQEYPFENLVERVSVVRDVSRNPLFDVMFNMLNHTEYSGELMGLNSEVKHTSGISKFDMTLTVVDFGNQLLMSFEYCTKLFKPETIDHFIGYFKHVLNILPGLVNDNISVVDLISENEKQKLIIEFNNTKVDYPKGKTIQQLFEEQVA